MTLCNSLLLLIYTFVNKGRPRRGRERSFKGIDGNVVQCRVEEGLDQIGHLPGHVEMLCKEILMQISCNRNV